MNAASPIPNFDFTFPSTSPSPSRPLQYSTQDYEHHRTLSSASPSRSPSPQRVWVEERLHREEEIGEFEVPPESITPPPAATLAFPSSTDEQGHPAIQTRTHQRSLTELLPFRAPRTRTNSISPQRSPAKDKRKEEADFTPSYTGDKDSNVRVLAKSRGGLSSWFTGSSAPIPVGIAIGGENPAGLSTMASRYELQESPVQLQRQPTSALQSPTPMDHSTTIKSQSAGTSRFSFFSSTKTPVQRTIQLPKSSLDSDEFLTLDIRSELFPDSLPQDPSSSGAFQNLLMNAESLLLRMQTAYKLRTHALHELSSARSAATDELEAAETRAQILCSQLENMVSEVAEQNQTISDLVTQLAMEKQARAEEKEARERSIQLVKGSRLEHSDLGIEEGNWKWRQSAGSGFSVESDAESGAESVFSRPRSPNLITSSAASTMTMESTPEILQASFGRMVANPNSPASNSVQTTTRPKAVERSSTFQKILKGISNSPQSEARDIIGDMSGTAIGTGGAGCENCRGKDASVAWDAVGLLRTENKGLKDRVESLEAGIDEALDLSNGLRL